jgi:hypothetical protein
MSKFRDDFRPEAPALLTSLNSDDPSAGTTIRIIIGSEIVNLKAFRARNLAADLRSLATMAEDANAAAEH